MARDPRMTEDRRSLFAEGLAQETVGAPLLPAGSWMVDPGRSTVGFRVKKMGMYYVKGRFHGIAGTLDARDDGTIDAEARIDATSIDTRIPPRDAHLRSSQFLDVGTYPEIRFRTESVEPDGDGGAVIRARMEIHGVHAPVTLRAHLHGAGEEAPARIHLEGTLNRHDFGIRPPQPFEMIVGDEVHLDVEIAVQPAGPR